MHTDEIKRKRIEFLSDLASKLQKDVKSSTIANDINFEKELDNYFVYDLEEHSLNLNDYSLKTLEYWQKF